MSLASFAPPDAPTGTPTRGLVVRHAVDATAVPREEAVRRYAAMGWSVIVLEPGSKRPLHGTRWSQAQRERADLGEVLQLLEEHPGAGLGVVTGSVSGIAVVDIDDPEVVLPGHLLDGPYVETATPGHQHLYYAAPRPVPTARKLFGGGVELMGEKGYVVLPPTSIKGRRYTWHGDPAQGLPLLPVEILRAAQAAVRRMPMSMVLRGVLQGHRNVAATRVAGFFLHRCADAHEAWVQVLAWNPLNVPPLDQGELKMVFDSILGRHRRWIARSSPTRGEMGPLEELVVRLLARHGDLPLWGLHRGMGGDAATKGELEAAILSLTRRGVVTVAGVGPRGAVKYGLVSTSRTRFQTPPQTPDRRAPEGAPETPGTSTPVDCLTPHTPRARKNREIRPSKRLTQPHTKGGGVAGGAEGPQAGASRGRWDGRLEGGVNTPVPKIEQVWKRTAKGQLIVSERGDDGVLRVVGWSLPDKEGSP